MLSDPIADLRRYLVECPQKFDYRFKTSVREDIRKALFQAASADGKYMKTFFPMYDVDAKGKTFSSQLDPSGSEEKRDWIMHSPSSTDPSHPGRPCVRKFTKGEPTYRCL